MKLEKYLTEGRNDLVTFADRKDLVILADNITRLIAGDRKVAINNLKKLEFDLDFSKMKPEEYNAEYKRLNDAILKALGV